MLGLLVDRRSGGWRVGFLKTSSTWPQVGGGGAKSTKLFVLGLIRGARNKTSVGGGLSTAISYSCPGV